MKPVVILKTGSATPELVAERGDFDVWIAAGMRGPVDEALEFVGIDVPAGERLPDPALCGGVVITGSSAMVSERAPWSEAAGQWLVDAHEGGVPILGICYGHQLLAHAFGGTVGRNPQGREIGTVEVALGAAGDPLLGERRSPLIVQETHSETVLELPDGAERLGANDTDRNQSFRLGERAWGVQFHPEFDAAIMRHYITARRADLRAEGLDVDGLLAACRDSEDGRAILVRFGEIVREASRSALR